MQDEVVAAALAREEATARRVCRLIPSVELSRSSNRTRLSRGKCRKRTTDYKNWKRVSDEILHQTLSTVPMFPQIALLGA